jgi:hypothetical protein
LAGQTGRKAALKLTEKPDNTAVLKARKIKYRFINAYRLIEYRSATAMKLDYIYYCGH